jgi:hypothetical protein
MSDNKKTDYADIPNEKFDNDPPPPDESTRAPGSILDNFKKSRGEQEPKKPNPSSDS